MLQADIIEICAPLGGTLPLALGLLRVAMGVVEAFVLSGLSGSGLPQDLIFAVNRLPWA